MRRLVLLEFLLPRHSRGLLHFRLPNLNVLRRKVLRALGIGLAIPLCLLLRMVRPIILVRFGRILSERIGSFAYQTEVYLCERDSGIQDPKAVDFFYYDGLVSNLQLKKMVDRDLRVSKIAGWLDRANHRLPGGEKHRIPMTPNKEPDTNVYAVLSSTPVHLRFNAQEEHRGIEGLSTLGVPDGTPFVCFIGRDSAYLDSVLPNIDWQYHDYRDCSIDNFVPAAEHLATRGYFAIRMGAVVKEPVNSLNPKIIDYASNGRTDFLDVYLSAKCAFFLTSGLGIDTIGTIFRRPIACVNFIPLRHAPGWGPNDLFIPKNLWLRKEQRWMSFRETCESAASSRSDQYEELGLDVIENTADEITALAVEMDERLNNSWQMTEEDEELQRRFWAILNFGELHKPFLPRIGAEFLRQNRVLLD